MAGTLTIRNLDDDVKQALRILAATNGRSMEAEARRILAEEVSKSIPDEFSDVSKGNRFDHLRGIWKGRMSTDEVMGITRGD